MDFVRTPDARFEGLPGYPFEPHYEEVDGLRLHRVDEGPRDAAPVVLLHGEPTWSYLYRKMSPVIAAARHRVVAPDLVGFGRSDKPTDRSVFSYARHVEWLRCHLFDRLELRDVTLVCQDWGGLLGLRLVAEHPDRFARVVAANTLLPTGDNPGGPAFEMWKKVSQEVDEWSGIIGGACVQPISEAEKAAYDAPFPDEPSRAASRQFPLLVPVTPDDPAAPDNRRAWKALQGFAKPFLIAFSDKDPITGAHRDVFLKVAMGEGSRTRRSATRATSSRRTRARSSPPW